MAHLYYTSPTTPTIGVGRVIVDKVWVGVYSVLLHACVTHVNINVIIEEVPSHSAAPTVGVVRY